MKKANETFFSLNTEDWMVLPTSMSVFWISKGKRENFHRHKTKRILSFFYFISFKETSNIKTMSWKQMRFIQRSARTTGSAFDRTKGQTCRKDERRREEVVLLEYRPIHREIDLSVVLLNVKEWRESIFVLPRTFVHRLQMIFFSLVNDAFDRTNDTRCSSAKHFQKLRKETIRSMSSGEILLLGCHDARPTVLPS